MTTDVLRDYMMGRLSGARRARVRDRLRVDPGFRAALRRLRGTTLRIRSRLGRVGEPLPAEWLPLVERIAERTRTRAAEPANTGSRAERTKTWV